MTPDVSNMLFNIGVTIFITDNAMAFFVNILVNSIFYDEFLILVGLRAGKRYAHSHTTESTAPSNVKKTQN